MAILLWAMQSDGEGPLIGARRLAGRYRLLNPLGEGTVGTVWLALDDVLGRDVAIKEVHIPPDLSEDRRAEIREAAVREANVAARLRHPSIVTVHDVLVEDGRPWVVMELLSGASLERTVAERGPLPPHQLARVGVHVLSALAVAHAAGIVHRDVKPGNVFLTRTGRAVLTDFGAAAIEGETTIGRTVHLIGTPAYVAPERLSGADDGPAGDLWSLGATLYFGVEGRPPHDAESPIEVLRKVLTEPARPAERAGPLGPVLEHLLAADPAVRPPLPVAERMLRDLASGRTPALPPPPPSPTSAPTGPQPRGRGRTWLVAAAMIVGLPLVSTGTALGVNAVDRAAAPEPKPTRLSEETGKYAIPLRFCSMLTDAQIRRLVPTGPAGEPNNREGCQWPGKGVALTIELVGGRGFGLSREESTWGSSPARAHEWYRNELNTAFPSGTIGWKWPDIGAKGMRSARVTDPEPVTGIGDEAFAIHQYDNRTHLKMEQSYIVTRVDNLVIKVGYTALDGARDERTLRQSAATAARWFITAMDRTA
ncbi:hypothetical protein DP939_21180 [Spongiactinospora rosea]|uniref:non-specific serine/threonine protein kinase n=1 Tax=Spongiactinospora rosea TaxID=2248750 RepID=A0A366LWP2_9ACTN|nr:serine/threonine-protein kinase [Spongiactinospora rosea]RBQ18376.1 hypothetical protein DP939_21180 [Spongiactinospora rosea]